MLLDNQWIYLPLFILTLGTLLQSSAALLLRDSPYLTSALYLWILVCTLIISSNHLAKPLHTERLGIVLTLGFLYLTLFYDYHQLIWKWTELQQVHDHAAKDAFRIIYTAVWVAYGLWGLRAYLQKLSPNLDLYWTLNAIFALSLAMLPLEPLAFARTQAPWTWMFRTTLTLTFLVVFSLGDLTMNTYRAYRSASHIRERKSMEMIVTIDTIDVEMQHMISWTPTAIWPLFVHPHALWVGAVLLLPLGYGVFVRWKCARTSEVMYVSQEKIPKHGKLLHQLRKDGQLPNLSWILHWFRDTSSRASMAENVLPIHRNPAKKKKPSRKREKDRRGKLSNIRRQQQPHRTRSRSRTRHRDSTPTRGDSSPERPCDNEELKLISSSEDESSSGGVEITMY